MLEKFSWRLLISCNTSYDNDNNNNDEHKSNEKILDIILKNINEDEQKKIFTF